MTETSLSLACEPLHDGQRQLLEAALREGVDRVYVITGRGWGKSLAGCVLAAAIAYGRAGSRVVVTYPTFGDCRDIGAEKFLEMLPEGTYTHRIADREFLIHPTGSKIVLRSRSSANAVKPLMKKGRGQTNTAVIHDEAAVDATPTVCHNYNATVRGPGSLGVYYITTPIMGWLHEELAGYALADSSGAGITYGSKSVIDPETGIKSVQSAAVIYGRTADNPYGGRELHQAMLADLDNTMARQELDGQWVALTGRMWDSWVWANLPNGNVWPGGWDRGKSWALSCDIGAVSSSWIAWQSHGHASHPIYVAVAEWQLQQAGVRQCLDRIASQVPCAPSRVYAGHDIHARSVADSALTPAYFVAQQWGSLPIVPLAGPGLDMRVRYDRCRALICSALGERRFAIARDIVSDDPTGRGIKKVIEQDAWPPAHARSGDYMPKDGRLEHCRDAIHHYLVSVSPPTYARK